MNAFRKGERVLIRVELMILKPRTVVEKNSSSTIHRSSGRNQTYTRTTIVDDE